MNRTVIMVYGREPTYDLGLNHLHLRYHETSVNGLSKVWSNERVASSPAAKLPGYRPVVHSSRLGCPVDLWAYSLTNLQDSSE